MVIITAIIFILLRNSITLMFATPVTPVSPASLSLTPNRIIRRGLRTPTSLVV